MNFVTVSNEKRKRFVFIVGFIGIAVVYLCISPSFAARTITYATFRDKLMGGWLGQGAGVSWAQTTEFVAHHHIIPDNDVPAWTPDMVNRMFDQDDNYCEIPFLICMRDSGITATCQQFGEYWRRTQFMLWCANDAARNNLRNGILAPWSGHYTRHGSVEDIDWQIESNWAGMLCPGLPVAAADLAFRAGHVMNYGDGVYGGVFTAVMQAAAYFAKDVMEIIQAGRDAIPKGSVYRQMIDDMIAWHAANRDWTVTWRLCEDRYGYFHRHRNSCIPDGIQCQCNGAYILMGLLYGNGNFEQSVRISMRCGKDSDCNPSSTAAILGNWIGFAGMDSKWKSGLSLTGRDFQATDLNFTEVIDLSCNLARRIVKMSGGTVTNEGTANETWTIPDQAVIPLILEAVPGNNPDDPIRSTDGLYSQSVALMPTITSMTITPNNDGSYTFTANATAASGKTIREYQWFFGDFSYKSGQTVTHSYRASGTYPVLVYVTDNIGITAWREQKLTAVGGGTYLRRHQAETLVRRLESAQNIPQQCYTIRGQRLTAVQGASSSETRASYGIYLEKAGNGAKTKNRIQER